MSGRPEHSGFNASKVLHNGLLGDTEGSLVFLQCSVVIFALIVLQKCFNSASKVLQKCFKNASKLTDFNS